MTVRVAYKKATHAVALALIFGIVGCGSSEVGSLDMGDKDAVKKGMSGGGGTDEVKRGGKTFKSIKDRPGATPETK